MHYSVQPRDQIFVKDYWCLTFAKNMSKNIRKNIRKDLSGKYSQKSLDHAEKCADRNTKISKNLQEINSETVTNEHDKEIPTERYICL